MGRRNLSACADRTLAEGLHAYAAQQAGIEVHMAAEWSDKWELIRALAQPIVNCEPGWELKVFEGPQAVIDIWTDSANAEDYEDTDY